jgi:hypothetical protein
MTIWPNPLMLRVCKPSWNCTPGLEHHALQRPAGSRQQKAHHKDGLFKRRR